MCLLVCSVVVYLFFFILISEIEFESTMTLKQNKKQKKTFEMKTGYPLQKKENRLQNCNVCNQAWAQTIYPSIVEKLLSEKSHQFFFFFFALLTIIIIMIKLSRLKSGNFYLVKIVAKKKNELSYNDDDNDKKQLW